MPDVHDTDSLRIIPVFFEEAVRVDDRDRHQFAPAQHELGWKPVDPVGEFLDLAEILFDPDPVPDLEVVFFADRARVDAFFATVFFAAVFDVVLDEVLTVFFIADGFFPADLPAFA